jgi:hypothetical protein
MPDSEKILNELKKEEIDPNHFKEVYKLLEGLRIVKNPEKLYVSGLDSTEVRKILECMDRSGIVKKKNGNVYELNEEIEILF